MMRDSILARLEVSFFILGSSAALLYCLLCLPAIAAHRSLRSFHPAVAGQDNVFPPGSLEWAYMRADRRTPASSLLGSIRIPDVGIAAPIVEGVDDMDLLRGVGHVPGSAMGGGLGNVVLAAHRDSNFRFLGQITPGMKIQLTGSDGTYQYSTDTTEIVTPDHLEVMAIASRPTVTLVTCYPFDFIGSAPRRFIVKAHLVSFLPYPGDRDPQNVDSH